MNQLNCIEIWAGLYCNGLYCMIFHWSWFHCVVVLSSAIGKETAFSGAVCAVHGWLVPPLMQSHWSESLNRYLYVQTSFIPKANLSTGIVYNLWSRTVLQILCGKMQFHGVWSGKMGSKGIGWWIWTAWKLNWKNIRISDMVGLSADLTPTTNNNILHCNFYIDIRMFRFPVFFVVLWAGGLWPLGVSMLIWG